jgi:hypothetical protein
MKSINKVLSATLLSSLAFGLATLSSFVANAHPFASNVTGTNSSGFVSFTLNEDGAFVTVVYEDGSTNTVPGAPLDGSATIAKGSYTFYLEPPHTGFKIICSKQGNGVPFLISSDTYSNSVWNNANNGSTLVGIGGVGANKYPKIGTNFGRLYVAQRSNFTTSTNNKPLGVYALNADQTYITGPVGNGFYSGSGAAGPWRVRANDDGTVLVNDFSTANASLLQFAPDLSSSNLVLAIIGQNQAGDPPGAGIHGDMFGTPFMTGSLATSNLVLYTFDSGMAAPSDTNCIKGPLTSPGSYNNVYQYNIGAGPLPWNKRPDFAYTMGLDGIAELRTEGCIGKDGKIICGYGRANFSNPDIQILLPFKTTNGITGDPANKAVQDAAKDPTNWVYTSGVTPPFNTPPNNFDPWNGISGSGLQNGLYAGVRVSPDGQYLAAVDINNGITIATLTNGIPNDGTIFGIQNAPNLTTGGATGGRSRGMDWDAADNIWVGSALQGLLRCYSLGLTTTCTTSNDWTGTNGTFQFSVPAVQASVAVIHGTASQNYVNNIVNPGTPIPGVFRISLNMSSNPAPVTVSFVRSGSAGYTNNYTINTNETPNGVTVNPTSVVFPAGSFSGSNGPNWNVDVKIIPTAIPVSGPTVVFNVRLLSGANYSAAAPLNGSIAILNTGPQLLQLSAAAPSTLGGMNRGIPHDQARFIITRLGDTNGPGNDAVNPVTPRPVAIPNINYFAPASGSNFMAKPSVDFTAQAQNFTGAQLPDGAPGITIPPGAVTVVAAIGNPIKHTNTSLRSTNLQVIVNLTNVCNITNTPGCNTNLTDSNGRPYEVTTTSLTLNEFDNAVGGEVVLWSNPLTNSYDSTNWTLVFASIAQGECPTLPLVVSNYDNTATNNGAQYQAWFGKPVHDTVNDGGPFSPGIDVPPSDTMIANSWSNALKVSVNKSSGIAGESGVNLYPQIPGTTWNGSNFMVFNGNYALRFDMFLSLYYYGINYPAIGTPAREFPAFGINHYGTNANWRLDINPRANGTGARPINADGEWCCINAASGSITPADYDMFISPAFVPTDNNGAPLPVTVPYTTNIFVGGPYTNGLGCTGTNVFNNGGVPNDQQSQNNNAFGGAPQNGIIKDPPFTGINSLGGAPDNAWVDVSLELNRQTNLTLFVARQAIFNSSTILPIFGTQNPIAPFGGTPMLGYLDPNADQSDYSAFVYYSNLRLVELSPFIPWTNQPVASLPTNYPSTNECLGPPIPGQLSASLILTQGTTFSLSSGAMFASNPLTNMWYQGTTNGPFPGGNFENGTPSSALATNIFATNNAVTNLSIASIQSGTNYISVWSDQAGSITSYIAMVEVIAGPGDKTVSAGVTTNLTVTPSGQNPPHFYQWKRGGTNIVNGTHFAGATTATLFITNVTAADAGVYSNLVTSGRQPGGTNAATDISVVAQATLTVITPPSGATVSPAATNALWGSPVTFTLSSVTGTSPFTYQWKRGGNDLSDGLGISGATTTALTLSNVTTTIAGAANAYTVGVTNAAGGSISSAGVLTVSVPPPNIATISVSLTTSNVTLTFSTTNQFDNTSAWMLQSAPVVTGPFTNDPSATFSNLGGGNFSVKTASCCLGSSGQDGVSFYRLLHVP